MLHKDVRRMNFIHIPKTGGTTVESLLPKKHALKHRYPKPPSDPWLSPWHFPPDLYEDKYNDTFKAPRFCIVREPNERFLSCESWSRGRYHTSATELTLQALEGRAPSEEMLHRMPQHMFVFARTGRLQCECVVAFEKMGHLVYNNRGTTALILNKAKRRVNNATRMPADFAHLYRVDFSLHREALRAWNICYRPPAHISLLRVDP